MKKKLHLFLLRFLLALGLCVALVITAYLLYFPSKKSTPPPLSTLESKIRSILELPLYEQVYHDIIYIGEEARIFGFRHIDKRLLFSIDILIEAGLDLTKGVNLTRRGDGHLVVELPEPEILLLDARESTIHQYFLIQRGGQVARLEYYDEIERAKQLVLQEALEQGILESAKEQAKNAVHALFPLESRDAVTLLFRPQEEEEGGSL